MEFTRIRIFAVGTLLTMLLCGLVMNLAGDEMIMDSNERDGDPPAELVVLKSQGLWISKAELKEMDCLTRYVAKALGQDESVEIKLRFPSDRQPYGDVPSVDLTPLWSPTDPSILSAAILRRLEKSKRTKVVPVINQKTSGGAAEALLRLLRDPSLGLSLVSLENTTVPLNMNETLSQIQQVAEKFGHDAVAILVLVEPDDLAEVMTLAAEQYPALERVLWIHPNSFNAIAEINKDPKVSKFAAKCGLSTFLVYPTQDESDVELRVLKYALTTESCASSSLQRSLAFVKTLKNVFRNNGIFPVNWQVWDLFLTKHSPRVAQVMQNSPWLIGSIFTANATATELSSIGHVSTELVRKHDLLDIYAPAATKCDREPGVILLKNTDLFSLEPVQYVFKPDEFPDALIIPQNHGFVITLECHDGREKRSAEITCSGDQGVPCVHSAFSRRHKRGLSEARQILAKINSRRVQYVVDTQEGNVPQKNHQSMERRIGNNRVERESRPVPLRLRRKAVAVYKTMYQEGLSRDQMLETLPEVVKQPRLREEVEKLIIRIPDERGTNTTINRAGAEKPKYPLPPYARWLVASAGPLAGCVGTSSGVLLCSMLAEASTNFAVTSGCHANGFQQIGGSCQFMMGRLFQVVHDDQSVICTALHSWGLMSDLEYAVDASFGHKMAAQDPVVLIGYHKLARPIAGAMNHSWILSYVVSIVTKPWVDHMMHELGHLRDASYVGSAMMRVGVAVARVAAAVDSISSNLFAFFSSSACAMLAGAFLITKTKHTRRAAS